MKIKLFYTPEFHSSHKPGYPKEPARMPLISLPLIKSFLEKYDFKVKQDDLDIKVFSDNKYSKNERKKVDMSLFDDRKRIANFIKTGEDEQLEENARKILKKTKYKNFDMVCFSSIHSWTFAPLGATIVLSKIIKEETGSLITLGGPRYEKAIEGIPLKDIQFIDFFCLLSNHYEFTKLLLYLDSGYISKKDLFQGIIYNEEKIGKILDKKKHKTDRIKELCEGYFTKDTLFPLPNFDGLPLNLYRYIPKDIKENRISNKKILILPYYFIAGCSNNCIFCKDSYSNNFIIKKPELVAEELKKLSKKYRTKQFIFTNTSINPTKAYAEKVANEIIKKDININWFDCATFNALDKELLKKLQQAGARRLVYGLECASPKIQKYIEKNINLDHASKILEYANKLNIWNEVEIICGLPYETEQDRNVSIDFLDKNKKNIDYFYLTKFYLTQSKLTKYPDKYGLSNIRDKKDDSHEGLRFDETKGLKWDEKKKQLDKAFEAYERFREKMPPPHIDGSTLHFYKLAYLYTIFDNKKDIKDHIIKYGPEID